MIRTYLSGDIYFDEEGRRHREDGPAVDFTSGLKIWYRHGEVHRSGGEPAMIIPDGTKYWVIDNKWHREDGPAIVRSNGQKHYYFHGKEIKCHSDQEYFKLLKFKAFW